MYKSDLDYNAIAEYKEMLWDFEEEIEKQKDAAIILERSGKGSEFIGEDIEFLEELWNKVRDVIHHMNSGGL